MIGRLLPSIDGTRFISTPADGRQSACARKNWYQPILSRAAALGFQIRPDWLSNQDNPVLSEGLDLHGTPAFDSRTLGAGDGGGGLRRNPLNLICMRTALG